MGKTKINADKAHSKNLLIIKISIISFIIILIILGILIDKKIIDTDEYFSLFQEKEELQINSKISSNITLSHHEIVIGNPKAEITIIEYVDYECPYCRKFYMKTYPKLKENYIDKGTVKLIIKDYPLIKIHKNSLDLAQSVHCANEQNKTKEIFDIIFIEKEKTLQDVINMSKSINMNHTQFELCIKNETYKEEILNDAIIAKQNNIVILPTFIIEDEIIEGVKSYEFFDNIIKEKLKKKQDEEKEEEEKFYSN